MASQDSHRVPGNKSATAIRSTGHISSLYASNVHGTTAWRWVPEPRPHSGSLRLQKGLSNNQCWGPAGAALFQW